MKKVNMIKKFRTLTKPTVVISACLNGVKCRYDGSSAKNKLVDKLKLLFNLVNICPEVGIGLGVPRKPIRLLKYRNTFKVIQEGTGLDLTKKLEKFSVKFVKKYKKKVHGVILKSRSPSCAVGDAKYYVNDKVSGKTYGIFAKVVKNRLSCVPIIDEEKLKNKKLFAKFLTKVFFKFYNLNS